MNGPTLYEETQGFPGWTLVLVGLVVFLVAGLLTMRLTTVVTPDAVQVRYGFLYRTRIPISEIISAEARAYRPVRDYGGWGIRGFGRRRALNARGNLGVLLTRQDGSTLMIGSQRPRELLEALARAGVSTKDNLPVVVKEF
jgi:hypothetical protein